MRDANGKISFKITYSESEFNSQGDWVKRKETTETPGRPTTVSIHHQQLEYYPASK
jgi:hypothetical protein